MSIFVLADHPFLLGGTASLGDITLCGGLYAHLYRDPESGYIMRKRAPRVAEWCERMNGVNISSFETADKSTLMKHLFCFTSS